LHETTKRIPIGSHLGALLGWAAAAAAYGWLFRARDSEFAADEYDDLTEKP
jgi:hypothetical protein